jgi:hypothetical protein
MAEIAERAPNAPALTDYDRLHLITYFRLLDADAAGAAWEDVARQLLGCDVGRRRAVAQLTYETHLARARWMAAEGHLQLLGPRNA